ncbi:MAG: chloramphenicol acetyltransferase [Bacteroidaceae bacterium]|nr:chloramphenicol acetyltransferase [Bacteroidaceae bacterium]
MKQEIDPKETSRAQAFELWMKSPMPMVTLVKTFDVTHLRRVSQRQGLKFNMLLCWCIGKAASQVPEFYLLPKDGKLFRFDRLGINVIVDNVQGGISNCDVPYCDNLQQFGLDYDKLTKESATSCRDVNDDDAMIVGTSAVVGTELDCIVNQYTGIYNNPFLVWGRFKRRWFRITLTISLQFHHVQFDGQQAALFLERLQQTLNTISPK